MRFLEVTVNRNLQHYFRSIRVAIDIPFLFEFIIIIIVIVKIIIQLFTLGVDK